METSAGTARAAGRPPAPPVGRDAATPPAPDHDVVRHGGGNLAAQRQDLAVVVAPEPQERELIPLAANGNRQWRKLIYKSAAAGHGDPSTMRVVTRKAIAQVAPGALHRITTPPPAPQRTGRVDPEVARTYVAPHGANLLAASFADGLATGHVERAAGELGMTPRKYLTPGVRSYIKATRTGMGLAPQYGRAATERIGPATVGANLTVALRETTDLSPVGHDVMRERPIRDFAPVLRHRLVPRSLADVQSRFTIERRPGPAVSYRIDPHAPAAVQNAQRDAHAARLQTTVDRTHVQISDALAHRDAYHVELGRQGTVGALKGLIGARRAIANGERNEAARIVGASIGSTVDSRLAVESLNQQRRIEKQINPFLDAREALLPLRTQQAFERDRNMTTDGADRFYDAFETPEGHDIAVADAARTADRALPSVNLAHANFVPTTVSDTAMRVITGVRNRDVLPNAR